ncbi:hypothetical protein [Lewinella sp. LCG006]|uniref:hypothetical protein n=1 Tax=Lewinella sp. LCG006 TaxID=3231911 RepID=UPI0034613B89
MLLLLLCLLSACTPEPTQIEPAFYHWQTQMEVDNIEQHYLQEINARRLYVKFFDVAWQDGNNEAVPQATLERRGEWTDYDIVPTVFITNETMVKLAAAKREDLAERILQKIASRWPGLEPREIQLDCDWTEGSRDAYFQLLKLVRERLPATTKLSVTLRLHQYRYPEKTGVPPADRAMLMFYNMGDLTDWQEPNSILNLEKARPYLKTTTPYPLPLDLALPIFNWGVLFREGKMIKLLPGLTAKSLAAIGAKSLIREDGERFEITKSTYLEGYYLYRGDQLRLETIRPQQLIDAARLLRSVATSKDAYLSFYHLDSALLSQFSVEDLQRCLAVLKNEME